MNRGTFARMLLSNLGAPVTLHNRRALQAQMAAEGGSSRGNPFNSTQKMPGSTDVAGNSAHVQNYVSAEQGVNATAKTLRGKGHGYEAILACLHRNAPATETIAAVGSSDWGTVGTLAAAVLDDIKHNRQPNRLEELEAREIAR